MNLSFYIELFDTLCYYLFTIKLNFLMFIAYISRKELNYEQRLIHSKI